MMMKVKPSVLASLLVAFMSMLGLWLGQKQFAVDLQADSRLAKLSARVMEENIKNQMLVARLEDFRQEVAMTMPNAKQLESQPRLRDLASVIPHSSTAARNETKSLKLLSGVKEKYAAKKYEESMKASQELISQFPESTAQLEASYYLVMSYYQTGNKQEALNWAEKMLGQFPESAWTARSLLVMADIYKEQGRKNDLLDLYQIILDTFKDEDIKSDVNNRLSSLEM
jgi:TolA-binding protein